ncbi:MAG: bifunctional aspartate kinase/homoserine dehydrogenase I [Deltaproteobacteria bacterium]|nr:MAG: bifunctional aspartate kinase/homoserine dehydrogenase I [Deltaproteobacteria bacterium]
MNETTSTTETPFRVMKFGGSSSGAPERLVRSTDLIARERAEGPVAVVFSAMGDTTDWLIEAFDAAAAGDMEAAEATVDRVADLAVSNGLGALDALARVGGLTGERPEITPVVRELLHPLRQLLYGVSLVRERTAQTLDLVLSFGERTCATVMTLLLQARGVPAVFVDAREWTVTDDRFGSALVDWESTRRALAVQRETWGDRVPVHTGFLGRTPDGRTTTLGRNGSDYTTTLLARALGASEVQIWTDVSGVMTADPALVADAYPIARLSYMEALELANFGARMFHPRTMIPLIESGIPLRIRNTMHPDAPGTRVDACGAQDEERPTSVASLENLAMLDIEYRRLDQQTPAGERVLRALQRAGIPVWMATQSAHGQSVAVAVPAGRVDEAKGAIADEFEAELDRGDVQRIGQRLPVTLLSLVAETMGQHVNVAGRFFHALGAVGINIRAIAQGASSRSISCVIDAAETPVAVRTVHAAFNFAHHEISLLVLGHGTVGSQLLAQVASQKEKLETLHGARLRVVGLADSRRLLWDESGLDLGRWQTQIEATAPKGGPPVDEEVLDRLRRLPLPVLVDCTAADGMGPLYAAAFERGIHVVGANKKPLTLNAGEHAALMAGAREHHRAWHYETTVGASLPVIDTLKNLVRTGDRVLRIEGSFSGTLGYLTNELMAGRSLSAAVREAHRLGYTEPRPQEDLSGMDVARKALILARELGLAIELDQVVIEPLVSAEAMAVEGRDAFFAALEREDATFAERIARLVEREETLRYLAVIDPGTEGNAPSVRVGPVELPADHPAVRLRGSEAFVAFQTLRYSDYPLIVQGAGAGGAVTAAGVLADVLRIGQAIRGRRPVRAA